MTITIPSDFNAQYYTYRLPCGVCERTNKKCPITLTYTTGIGTGNTNATLFKKKEVSGNETN